MSEEAAPRVPTAAWWVLAALLGLLLASLSPAPWPDGGEVTVHFGVEELRVSVGEEASRNGLAVAAERTATGVEVRIRHPPEQPPTRAVVGWPGLEPALLPVLPSSDVEAVASRRAPRKAGLVLGLLGVVVVLWLSEVVPLWVTSLGVPIVLAAGGSMGPTEALSPFFHPVIALFFAGFVLAAAMQSTGFDRRVAIGVVARAGGTPVTLFAALLLTSAVASMFMSNTAAAATLIPIALAICEPLGEDGRGFRKAAVLGIAYAATLGGIGSAIGTPANPLALQYLAEVGRPVSFTGWFAYGLPLVVAFLPVMGGWVWWRMGAGNVGPSFAEAHRVALTEAEALPRPGWLERRLMVVAALVVIGWLTDGLHGIHPGIVGLAGVVLLNLAGLAPSSTLRALDWGALLTFGGGLALGAALGDSGVSDWLVTLLDNVSGLPAGLGLAALAFLSLGLTAVASNTASAAILIPLALPLAGVLGEDPALLILIVALASSIDFALVIGTPPTMIAHSTGQVTAAEVFRIGIVLDLLAMAVLLGVVVGFWKLTGLVG